jgi:hypothetical protein
VQAWSPATQGDRQLTCNPCYTCPIVAQQRHLGTAARDLHGQLDVDLQWLPVYTVLWFPRILVRVAARTVTPYPAGIGPVVHRKAVVHQLADGSCSAGVVGMLAMMLVPQRAAYGHAPICSSHAAGRVSFERFECAKRSRIPRGDHVTDDPQLEVRYKLGAGSVMSCCKRPQCTLRLVASAKRAVLWSPNTRTNTHLHPQRRQ